MMRLRVLTEQGIDKFREYILALKDNSVMSCPDLNVEPYSNKFQPEVGIDEMKIFSTRMEIGEYLIHCFERAGIRRVSIIENRGVWTWLTYLWFNQLCPVMEGARKIREIAKYICSSDYTDYYRHYVAASYDIYSLHGEQISKLFLYQPAHIHNDFIEQVASRQYIISNSNLIEVLHQLYWNENSNKPKRGSTNRNRPGNVRRLKQIIGQLELTHDIYSMRAGEVLALLPEEFNDWKR